MGCSDWRKKRSGLLFWDPASRLTMVCFMCCFIYTLCDLRAFISGNFEYLSPDI
ncbi:hypothetical protein ASPWEDRAFT_145670 [Aspergillus wentii DTO 134E9]|uniref:Uncharacterized protein n=1 Tax=Aspergillus wentii DTO 134E9 TaxID=1073089 RepID=A0A1L9S0K4_ASPWE|nr:uncharacterized protein ASPWEDRAFT_145670 [Aspergillus wentii DTO 134E9]OJJ40699.1 hypothetical protein ASPWEDRAFT_145670 [Aspergillus wentii DTO 134E9]